MKLDFVVWEPKHVKNSVLLGTLEGVESKWQLNLGVPRKEADFATASFPMRGPYKRFTDSLRNRGMLIVASQRLKDFLEQWPLVQVQFLPVSIKSAVGTHMQKYYIVQPLHPVPCLDTEKCGADWSALDKTSIDYVEQLVISESLIDREAHKIKVERQLFRPKHFERITLVQRELAEAIDTAGFTGMEWIEIDEYSND